VALTSRFADALVFAAQLHQNQKRKGPEEIPYIAHLLTVAGIVIEYGGTEDEAIAALLHDAVEDQGGAPVRDRIQRRFGQEVTKIVDGCTDTDQTPKPPWRERKEKYVAHLRDAPPSTLLVATADKLANARSLVMDFRKAGHRLWERFNAGRDDTLWYYRSILEAVPRSDERVKTVAEELERAVAELEKLVLTN
jgi:GTP pyrophosphokinase